MFSCSHPPFKHTHIHTQCMCVHILSTLSCQQTRHVVNIQFHTGMTQRDGTGREEGSGWGTRVYLWRIHVDIWQNQYNIVKLKNKIKNKKSKYTISNDK